MLFQHGGDGDGPGKVEARFLRGEDPEVDDGAEEGKAEDL